MLRHRFEAIVLDWDGTAVRDRLADAASVRGRVEELCALGFDVAVVSGTNVANVDGQLGARPAGPGRLHLLLNRGSEVFRVNLDGPELVWARAATEREEEQLTEAATRAAEVLRARGLEVEVVSRRLNRRKLDLIPLHAWRDPPKARIGELVDVVEARLRAAGIPGLDEAAAIALGAAHEAGLVDARVTSDVKHLEIGLTDKGDSARWILRDLWRRGIAPGLVLIVGDELGPLGGLPGSDSLMLVPEAKGAMVVSVGVEPTGVPDRVLPVGGGPATFLRILDEQLALRRARAVPRVVPREGWGVAVGRFDPRLERVHEALLTLADGRMGTSGVPPFWTPHATPSVLTSGVYTADGPSTEIVHGPVWNELRWQPLGDVGLRRTLDLRTGLLRQEVTAGREEVEMTVFSALSRPGTVALRAAGSRRALALGTPLRPPQSPAGFSEGVVDGAHVARVRYDGAGIAAVAVERAQDAPGGRRHLERLAVYEASPVALPAAKSLRANLHGTEVRGYERELAEHREAWALRWEDADVVIGGDPELQLAVRFTLFHLMASVADRGEAAVGARGLTGPAYRGHVFWDADVYVLPFLAATHPEAARAMLEYRVRRLDAAKEAARALGYRGARFPWESAWSGRDVTPAAVPAPGGGLTEIRTGLEEEHVTAGVAWAAATYLDWAGDEEFAQGPGLELLVETARYWASRARLDEQGRAHIEGVIGPDEYHEHVDDNAYTNVMARWNLRRAASLAETLGNADAAEVESWRRIADALVDGYEPGTRLYQQFAGFFGLEPIVIAEVLPRRPVAADVVLGRERTKRAQVLKQADVLMLHHLVPEEVAPGSLRPNLSFYEPRTSHGSSLSPGVHASLFARAGRIDEALHWLRVASRIDLDDMTGTTAGGLHVGAMGAVWQALAVGFAGLRASAQGLAIDPVLPEGWDALEVRVRFRGVRARVRVEPARLEVEADGALPVRLEGAWRRLGPGTVSLSRR